jgi:hypothetical protein
VTADERDAYLLGRIAFAADKLGGGGKTPWTVRDVSAVRSLLREFREPDDGDHPVFLRTKDPA